MSREYKHFLDDILEAIENVEEFIRDMNLNDFKKDRKTQSAVINEIRVIGEAVNYIPDKIKNKYNQIEWKKISDSRIVFVHHYWKIKLELVWDIAINKLPELKEVVLKILEHEP
jgi:uncharacterized protein with HEPN domain